jgi:hypothetical protein
MEDDDESTKGEAPVEALHHKWWTWFISYCKRKIEERKAKNQEGDPIVKAARSTVRATWIIAGFTIILVAVNYFQLKEMKQSGADSSGQTNQMLEQYRRQVAQLTRQAGDTHDLAVAAKAQSDRTKTIADQAVIQANAARSAARTAIDTLHVSERAYIVTGMPRLDTDKKSVVITFINTGHIPSGLVQVVKHEALANTDVVPHVDVIPHFLIGTDVAEKHWSRRQIEAIIPGIPQEVGTIFDQMSVDKLNSGMQQIIVAGYVSYNDGFDSSPQRRWPFCFRTLYVLKIKQLIMTPCDPNVFIPKLELIDGYPNNEEKDDSLPPN